MKAFEVLANEGAGGTSCLRGPGTQFPALPRHGLSRQRSGGGEPSGSSAPFGSGLQGAAASGWSWGVCIRAGGCRHHEGHRGMGARGRSIAHGMGTTCTPVAGRGMVCRHLERGIVFPSSCCWGTSQLLGGAGGPTSILPGGWGSSVGLLVPPGRTALGPCWRHWAPHRLRVGCRGVGAAAGSLVGRWCRARLWGGLPTEGQILARRQGKQGRAPGARPGNLLPSAGGQHVAPGQLILLALTLVRGWSISHMGRCWESWGCSPWREGWGTTRGPQ